ncbi:hypothetical protein DBA30_15215 [Salmonella enterica]|nr:hypothetical protein [Salmonella enterica]
MIKGRYAAISAPAKSTSYILNNDLQTHQTTQKHGLYYRSGHFVDLKASEIPSPSLQPSRPMHQEGRKNFYSFPYGYL